jgi:3'(2'), 5'-bisphosphate nucleotidase
MLNKTQINIIIKIILQANEIAKYFFNEGQKLQIKTKDDNSPVTKADIEISKLINLKLSEGFPDISIICEENKNRTINGNRFFLIDPIDGTSGFIDGSKEFTINIGLIENNIPIFGAVLAPEIGNGQLYYTDENFNCIKKDLKTSQEEKLTIQNPGSKKLNILATKRMKQNEAEDFVNNYLPDCKIEKLIPCSSSLKFCRLSENAGNLLIGTKPTMQWDTAAGHAVAKSAGCQIIDINTKKELEYQGGDYKNQPFYAKT